MKWFPPTKTKILISPGSSSHFRILTPSKYPWWLSANSYLRPSVNGRLTLSRFVFPTPRQVRSHNNGCYTDKLVINICVRFGEDFNAICLVIVHWKQASLWVLKSNNGLSSAGGLDPGRVLIFWWRLNLCVLCVVKPIYVSSWPK